ncbi:hypothetical protein NX059_008160 [Plenodomus lindquistii]|nr:hypothetical protein NX059_008160 [Plenodomus lindquistii]
MHLPCMHWWHFSCVCYLIGLFIQPGNTICQPLPPRAHSSARHRLVATAAYPETPAQYVIDNVFHLNVPPQMRCGVHVSFSASFASQGQFDDPPARTHQPYHPGLPILSYFSTVPDPVGG